MKISHSTADYTDYISIEKKDLPKSPGYDSSVVVPVRVLCMSQIGICNHYLKLKYLTVCKQMIIHKSCIFNVYV